MAQAPAQPGEEMSWQLLGAGPRILWLALRQDLPCGATPADVRPEVQAANGRTITISVVYRPSAPLPAPEACTPPAVSIRWPARWVRLPATLRGQEIVGVGRTSRVFDMDDRAVWFPSPAPGVYGGPMPDLTGLRVPDAKKILLSLGVPAAAIRFPAARRGFVRTQEPKPRELLLREATVQLDARVASKR